MIHPVIVNPALDPVVDVLNPVGWRAGNTYPSALALLWRDPANAKPLRYITFTGKYLVVKNV